MGSALIISLRKRRIRCPTRSKHRLYLPFVRQNAGGFRKAPSTFEGGALRRAVPAPLSGPRGLRCRGKCPGEGSYTTAPLSFGQCPLPCPAQEACIAGDSAPGRGHTHQRPFVIGQCPLPCPAQKACIAGDSAPGRGHTHQRPLVVGLCPPPCLANLFVLLTLPCPVAFPPPFIFSLAGPARRRSPARFLLAKKGRFPVPLCADV